MNEDPYKTLGISRESSDEEIKKAYSSLAKKYHPDLNPGDDYAEQKMKEINAAYNQIMKGDVYSRQNDSYQTYSSEGQTGFEGFDFGGFGGFGFGPFGGFSYGGDFYGAYQDENEPNEIRAARNYINARHYSEAINVLSNIETRDAQWYYLSAIANSGLGKNIAALEYAQMANKLEPNNPEYINLLKRLSYSSDYYKRASEPYGRTRVNPSLIFLGMCLLQSFCFGFRCF